MTRGDAKGVYPWDGDRSLDAELARLRALLRAIRDCEEPRCGLCASCLAAAQAVEDS